MHARFMTQLLLSRSPCFYQPRADAAPKTAAYLLVPLCKLVKEILHLLQGLPVLLFCSVHLQG